MRFAVTATDRYLGVFTTLVERGWIPLKVFTTPVDNRIHRNTALLDYARRLKIEVQISRLSENNLRELAERDCQALVVASYSWRVPDWRPHLKYAVNFHPSPLPEGRGPYPAPAAILQGERRWAVSCHKLEYDFDSGDILRQAEFDLARDEDHDSLDLKIQLAANRLSGEVADGFPQLWDAACPQGPGSYCPAWTDSDRTLDFSGSVQDVLRTVRAFGPIECLAHLNGTTLFVRRAVGWSQTHAFQHGSVVHANGLSLVVAVSDGYVGLTEWSLIRPNTVTGNLSR